MVRARHSECRGRGFESRPCYLNSNDLAHPMRCGLCAWQVLWQEEASFCRSSLRFVFGRAPLGGVTIDSGRNELAVGPERERWRGVPELALDVLNGEAGAQAPTAR